MTNDAIAHGNMVRELERHADTCDTDLINLLWDVADAMDMSGDDEVAARTRETKRIIEGAYPFVSDSLIEDLIEELDGE